MNEQQLLDLKNKIDRSKTKQAELQGRRAGLLEDLKKKWKCNSVEEAKAKLEQLDGEITDLEDKRDKAIEELQEKYDL